MKTNYYLHSLVLVIVLAAVSWAPYYAHADESPRTKGHGNERITVKKSENDGMQFKSIPVNETENMFQSTPTDQMNITMQEANISMQGYVSDEVKAQQEYKYYNNTNLYITFKQKYLKGFSTTDMGQTPKDMAKTVILKELSMRPAYKFQVKIKQAFQSYIVLELGKISDLNTFCELMSHRDEVLACEYLQMKRIFGRTANINEMAKFKSKVKKQEPIPEPPAAPVDASTEDTAEQKAKSETKNTDEALTQEQKDTPKNEQAEKSQEQKQSTESVEHAKNYDL